MPGAFAGILIPADVVFYKHSLLYCHPRTPHAGQERPGDGFAFPDISMVMTALKNYPYPIYPVIAMAGRLMTRVVDMATAQQVVEETFSPFRYPSSETPGIMRYVP